MAQLSQKYGPVMYLKLGSQDSLVISSAQHAKEVFRNHDLTFSERPKLIVLDLLVTNKQGTSFSAFCEMLEYIRLRKFVVLPKTETNRLL